jgi:hypothetical protein
VLDLESLVNWECTVPLTDSGITKMMIRRMKIGVMYLSIHTHHTHMKVVMERG